MTVSASQIAEFDRAHVMHPWSSLDEHEVDGPMMLFDRADGCYVYDAEGNQFLDAIGGLWCVNVGYGRRELIDAATRQMERIPFFSSFVKHGVNTTAELAGRLAELAPGSLNHIHFTTGGSTANDSAIRLIHNYNYRRGMPDKCHVITRKDAYHGSTYLAIQLIGKEPDKVGFRFDVPWVHQVKGPNLYRRTEGTTESEWIDILAEDLESTIMRIGPENVAAFFAETVQGAGGVVVAPDGYLIRMAEICKAYDVLLVVDEVVTGFGRLGHWFSAKDKFGVQPDIITCAKGLTSGYAPLGATIISDEIYEVLAQPSDHPLSNGFTYGGHPVACAVALANIELMIKEKLFDNVRTLGPYFCEQINTLSDLPLVGDTRGDHFMQGVEYVKDKSTKELFAPELDVGERIAEACAKRGVIVRPVMHLNVISPPLTLNRDQIDQIVDVLRESVLEVAGSLQSQGEL